MKLQNTSTDLSLPCNHQFNLSDFALFLSVMKNTKINDSDLPLYDTRIQKLHSIVCEVLESTEWEAVKSNIFEIGITKGQEIGFEIGLKEGLEKGREEN